MTTPGKRERENKKTQKRLDKERRRWEKRDMPRGGFEVVSAEDVVGPVRSVEEVMLDIQRGPTESRRAAPLPLRLFVGSLSEETTSAKLRATFEAICEVVEGVVITDRDSGRSRGIGFVTLVDRRDGPRVIEALHNSELDGRRLVVNVATASPSSSSSLRRFG